MNHLNITVVRGANRVLYGCGRETFLEEAVHMAGKDGLELFLLLEPGDEVHGGLVSPLLDLTVTPFLSGRVSLSGIIFLGYLKGDTREIGAVAVIHLQLRLAELGCVNRHMD